MCSTLKGSELELHDQIALKNCPDAYEFCPGAGTQISDLRTDMETSGPVTVKGFATIDNVALINVEVRLQTRRRSCLATAHGGLGRFAALDLQSGFDRSYNTLKRSSGLMRHVRCVCCCCF